MSLQSSIMYDIWKKEQEIKSMTIHHIMSHSGKLNCKNICNSYPCFPVLSPGWCQPRVRVASTVCQSEKETNLSDLRRRG